METNPGRYIIKEETDSAVFYRFSAKGTREVISAKPIELRQMSPQERAVWEKPRGVEVKGEMNWFALRCISPKAAEIFDFSVRNRGKKIPQEIEPTKLINKKKTKIHM